MDSIYHSSLEIANDYVFYRVKTTCPLSNVEPNEKPNTVQECMRYFGHKFMKEPLYDYFVSEVCDIRNYAEYRHVCVEIFSDSKVNIGKIVALFEYTAVLAINNVTNPMFGDLLVLLPQYLASFLSSEDCVRTYLQKNYGWGVLLPYEREKCYKLASASLIDIVKKWGSDNFTVSDGTDY